MATLQAPLFQRGVGGISVRPELAPVVLRELRRGRLQARADIDRWRQSFVVDRGNCGEDFGA